MILNEKKEKNSKNYNYLRWILFFPLLWGIIGLIKGRGFFPYIFDNIIALLKIMIIIIIFIVVFTLVHKNK